MQRDDPPAENTYEIGVATADITPPVGTPLAGNFRDDYTSQGVHTPLAARAMVVRRGSSAVAVIVADLLTIPESLIARVREQVQQACGLSADQVLASAIHSHSGPAAEQVAGPSAPAAVVDQMAHGMADCCTEAFRSCRPMPLWAAATQAKDAELFFNRRLRLKDGRTVMNWTLPPRDSIDGPWGPVDPQVGVLLAGEDRDRPALVAMNAALHAAVLAGDNWLINADWPGYYYQAVRQIFGSAALPLFLQGALGNINHLDASDPLQGRGFKEAQRIGSALALAVAAARDDLRPVTGPIAWSSQRLLLPARPISDQQLAWAQKVVADHAALGDAPRGQTDGIPDLLFARDQLELARRRDAFPAEVQVLRIGDLAIVGLPGEFFVEFGLALKQHSPARLTFIAGLANGSLGYVPTAAAFGQGGYEPTSWHYSKLAAEAGPLCVASAQQQLTALFAG